MKGNITAKEFIAACVLECRQIGTIAMDSEVIKNIEIMMERYADEKVLQWIRLNMREPR